jgi:S-adenosylmethionine synthetase
VTHVGKIYNVLARKICETLVTTVPEIAAAQCLMVSQIGSPISSPALVQVKIATRDESPVDKLRRRIVEATDDCVAGAPRLIDDFVTGAIDVF